MLYWAASAALTVTAVTEASDRVTHVPGVLLVYDHKI